MTQIAFNPDMRATPVLTGRNSDGWRYVLAVREHPAHPYCVWMVDENGNCEHGHYLGSFADALTVLQGKIDEPLECCVQPPQLTQFTWMLRCSGGFYTTAPGRNQDDLCPSDETFATEEEAMSWWLASTWEGIEPDDDIVLCKVSFEQVTTNEGNPA